MFILPEGGGFGFDCACLSSTFINFCMCPSFPFVGGMWDSIVLIPDHCLSFYFEVGRGTYIFPLKYDKTLFWKGFVVKDSKQEHTQVISFWKNYGKFNCVSDHLVTATYFLSDGDTEMTFFRASVRLKSCVYNSSLTPFLETL